MNLKIEKPTLTTEKPADKKNTERLTAVCKNGGFRLNLKLVLYLQSQCLTESLGYLNQPLLQAAKS